LKLQDSSQALVVVDYKDSTLRHVWLDFRGSEIRTVAPSGELRAMVSIPPCCLMIWSATDRPKPEPDSFVVKKGSKTLSMLSSLMPQPWSWTSMVTVLPFCCAASTIVPPCGIAWMAYRKRNQFNEDLYDDSADPDVAPDS